METRATTKQDWLRVQEEVRHRQIVAVNQAPTPTPSLYFGTRRCTYSDVVSVVTTVKPLLRHAHDAAPSPTKSVVKPAWEAPQVTNTETASPPFSGTSGNGDVQYVHTPLEGDSERVKRFRTRQLFALQRERTEFLAELHARRKERYMVEHSAALVIQRVFRGFLLRRRFRTIKDKLRVRKRIRVNLLKVTKGTAIITGEKERKARVLAKQQDAASKLQSAFRRWRGRRVLQRERALQMQERRERMTVTIQRVWRGAVARSVVRKLRVQRMQQQRQRLAQLVARVYRGYCARQRVRRVRLRRQTRASQRIQDAVRLHHARKALVLQRTRRSHETRNRAARTIQRFVRGALARARVDHLRIEEDHAIRVACAIAIQRVFRGFCGRKRLRFVRLFRVHTQAWGCGLHLTRIVRGFLGRKRATYERLEQETDLLVQVVKGNTSTVIDLLDGYGLVDEPVDLTTTNSETKNHALHLACRHGHMPILTHALSLFLEKAPQFVYAANAKGETPLELAITNNHEPLASFFLTKTSDLFRDATSLHPWFVSPGRRERSLLLDAARHGMASIVTKLVVLFPDIYDGVRDRDAWSHRTVLHEALLYSSDRYNEATSVHYEIMHTTLQTILSKLHVDVNAVDVVGFTPLHIAAMTGNVRAVQTLLEYGADVTVADKQGRTAWRLALLHGHETCFLEIRRKWLSDVSSIGTSNSISDDADVAKALAQAAAKSADGLSSRRRRVAVNLQPHLAIDVLHAARLGEHALVQFYLEELYANVNACDPTLDGDSLLMVVLSQTNAPLLRYLIEVFGDELDVAYVNRVGRSVVDAALSSPRLLEILIHEGLVNPCVPLDSSKEHRTVSHEAVRRGYDLRAWLRGYTFMPSLLVPLVDDTGRSPLHDAAAFGNVAAGALLVNAGLRGDVRDARDQRTPLHDACRSGAFALVRKLVRAYPTALWMRDAAGQRPIEAALQVANLEVVVEVVAAMRRGGTEQNDAIEALEKALKEAMGPDGPHDRGRFRSDESKGPCLMLDGSGTRRECPPELGVLIQRAFE